MIVRMIIHSKTIQRTNQTAALLKGFVPDKMKRLEGNSALSASVITARRPRGILTGFSAEQDGPAKQGHRQHDDAGRAFWTAVTEAQ